MYDNSLIVLDKNAVINNVNFLKKRLGRNVTISAVVKANAYGHGIEQIVPLFEEAGINHYAVFDFDEAERVKKSLTGEGSVMIMGWISDEKLQDAIEKGFEFFIFNPERLEKALEISRLKGVKSKIHLEAETGMNRSGLDIEAA